MMANMTEMLSYHNVLSLDALTALYCRLSVDDAKKIDLFLQEDAAFLSASQLILVSTYLDDGLKAFARDRARRGTAVSIFVCGRTVSSDFEDYSYSLFTLRGSEKKEGKTS